jgi:hypothetical protein
MPGTLTDITEQIDHSIDRGVNFLYDHQLPNGEFMFYYAPDEKMLEWCVPDSTVFPISLVASCLLQIKDRPKVKSIHTAAVGFLQYQMMRGGVWNYFTKWNPLYKYSPADVDDTVFASHVLRSLSVSVPDNKELLLANRNAEGLFYTWIVSRFSMRLLGKHWKTVFREFKSPVKSLLFWFKHEGARGDIDAMVNANVLHYLGINSETMPVVDYLLKMLAEKKESNADKWYHNSNLLYYFISRSYNSGNELEPAKQLIIDRTYAQYDDGGYFGNSSLDNAFAISTLLNFGHTDSRLDTAVQHLINAQQSAGNWERNIFFYAGPSKVVGWGSEEVTTGYCIEALCNYRAFTHAK